MVFEYTACEIISCTGHTEYPEFRMDIADHVYRNNGRVDIDDLFIYAWTVHDVHIIPREPKPSPNKRRRNTYYTYTLLDN